MRIYCGSSVSKEEEVVSKMMASVSRMTAAVREMMDILCTHDASSSA